jgi:integrase
MMYLHPLSRERSRHGQIRYYVKEFETDAAGKRLRLRQRHRLPDGLSEGTPAFVAAYQAVCLKISGGTLPAAVDRKVAAQAAAGRPEAKVTAASDSIDWLVKTFLIKAGSAWAPPTRYRIERSLYALRNERNAEGFELGACRFETLTSDHMEDFQRAWVQRHGQGEARLRVQHINQLYRWAQAKRHVTYNPCQGLPKITGLSPGKLKRGTVAWQPEDIALWRRVFPLGSEARTAIELGFLGGLRRSDICRIGPADIRDRESLDWRLYWREHKRRAIDPKFRRPVLDADLRDVLIAAEQAMPNGCEHYVDLARSTLDESERAPGWAEHLLEKAFLVWRAHAEAVSRQNLRHLTLHGTRAGGAVALCHAGWTPDAIAGWGGWHNIKQVMKYTEDVDRQALADDLMRERNAARRKGRKPAPRLGVVRR